MKMNEICFYTKLCLINASVIKLPLPCVQTVGTCHTCQELSPKMCNLDMYNTFFGGVQMVFGAFGSKCNHMCYFL